MTANPVRGEAALVVGGAVLTLRPTFAALVAAEGDRADPERAMTFGEQAGRLAGLAGALIGWRPAEFWVATPAELAAVIRALSDEDGAPAGPGDLARLQEMFPDG